MEIQLGDIVTLKKEHPCGSKEWEVPFRDGKQTRVIDKYAPNTRVIE